MKTCTVHGIKLATVDQGRGVPLVLVHGFPLDHTMWSGQIDALAEDCRVIAPDLRGFGASDVTEGTVTMAQFADDLAGLLDALEIGEPVVLCGLSMGGYVAFEFWRRHGSRLKALVLCDTRAASDSPDAAAGRLKTAETVMAEGPSSLVEAMLPKLFAETTRKRHPELIDSVRKVMLSTDPRAVAAAARGMVERADATAMLAKIACPTLVVVGRHDVISPPDEMRAIQAAIPEARLVEIDGAGHMSPLENPVEFNAAIRDFLIGLRA